MTVEQERRFFAKVKLVDSGCWEWTGRLSDRGYGQVSQAGRMKPAHHVTYAAFVGEVPEGHQIDHLCRNRACCNPAHLEAVTPRENWRRGETTGARAQRTNHCHNGHEFTDENTYMHEGRRWCRECRREYLREYAQRPEQKAKRLEYQRRYRARKRAA